jgi:hypothetical protein
VLQLQYKQGGRTYLVITARSIDEILNTDVNFIDADGNLGYIRYVVTTLDYLETVSP